MPSTSAPGEPDAQLLAPPHDGRGRRHHQGINDAFNSIGTVDPESGKADWKVNVPDNWLIQSITFEPKVEPVGVRAEGDPVALCRGAGAH